MDFPQQLAIAPRGKLDARVVVPGSKSYSNRALLVAALAEGDSRLTGVLDSDDTRVMARALSAMGAAVAADGDRFEIRGVGGQPKVPAGVIDVHASGTAARFLTAAMALIPGEARLDGIERMRQRPISDLTDALRTLGVDVEVLGEAGCPPLRVRGGRPFGGPVEVDASRSSQYVSALMLVAPYATHEVSIALRAGALVSRPYVELTFEVMEAFGAQANWRDQRTIAVHPGTTYQARRYAVEPDASTAAYFFAAAAITGGRVCVQGLPGGSTQPDMGLLDVLERMGCGVERGEDSVAVSAPADGLRAVDVDMNAMPDAVLALAVTALFAHGTTTIRNVANLRIKESDRLLALQTELRKLGAAAHADRDSLTVTPGTLCPAAIDTYGDHRVAMAFALAGLAIDGVVIRDPSCVSKSWPGYFEALERL